MEILDGDHWPVACHPEEEASEPVDGNCSSTMTIANSPHSEASGAQLPAVATQRPEVQDCRAVEVWYVGYGDVG